MYYLQTIQTNRYYIYVLYIYIPSKNDLFTILFFQTFQTEQCWSPFFEASLCLLSSSSNTILDVFICYKATCIEVLEDETESSLLFRKRVAALLFPVAQKDFFISPFIWSMCPTPVVSFTEKEHLPERERVGRKRTNELITKRQSKFDQSAMGETSSFQKLDMLQSKNLFTFRKGEYCNFCSFPSCSPVPQPFTSFYIDLSIQKRKALTLASV